MKLSIVIPARNEEGCLAATIAAICSGLRDCRIPFEIVLVDDHSTDQTVQVARSLMSYIPELRLVQNFDAAGFGLAVRKGLDEATGEAVVIMMADGSDSAEDLIRYWDKFQEGYDCVFGSRFMKGGRVVGYPFHKLVLNRLANWFIRLIFRLPFSDVTNAFKGYRREVIDGMRPLISLHFNLTVEMPLKAIGRGYSFAVVPVIWRNRSHGVSKLKIKEMGSRYLFIVLYLWLEKHLARQDYHRSNIYSARENETTPHA